MASNVDLSIEPLGETHETEAFDCGNQEMNDYLIQWALESSLRGLNQTFVACEVGSDCVIAYYSLRNAEIERDILPRRVSRSLPGYPVPAVLLTRLAVDGPYQGQRIGQKLLIDSFVRAVEVADRSGVFVYVVDALNDIARAWYLRRGFKELNDDPFHLFIRMKQVRKAVAIATEEP